MTRTQYAERPLEVEAKRVGNIHYVYIRRNIREMESEEGTAFSADEFVGKLHDGKEVTDEFIDSVLEADYKATAKRVREKRNLLLAECDNQMVEDYPIDHDKLVAYRQALRDIPSQEGFPYDVVFPIKP